MIPEEPYHATAEGILVPEWPVVHRDQEYDPTGFGVLRDMQIRHFWYRGRHRFVRYALARALGPATVGANAALRAIDLGGGCGGWIRYLKERDPDRFAELAVGDSSRHALEFAAPVVGPGVARYQIDLYDLGWRERWDLAFLLDVLEHIPDDRRVLHQIRESLCPGGTLIVTTPALQSLWTYNDDLAKHVRRYSRRDLAVLARESGLELVWSRYFMFLLSPLLLASRLGSPDLARMSPAEIAEHARRTHSTPPWPVNRLLGLIFAAETPLGAWLPFPWGTSVLAVMRRPR